MFVKQVEFAGHVVGYRVKRPTRGKMACLEKLDKPCRVSELRAFLGFGNYYQEFVRLYAHHAAPLYSMLQLSKSDPRKGINHPLHWTPERETAFEDLKRELLKPLALFPVNPDKLFVIRKDASDYPMGAILEQTDEKENHYPGAVWSRVLTPSQGKSWTPRTKEADAIVSTLCKWVGHIGLQPVCVSTDHQSLRKWHTQCVDTPSGPAARVARWHETFSKFDLSVVYVRGKDDTMADVLSRWVYPAGRALQDVSVHGDAKETELAKRLIVFERQWEEGVIDPVVKCFVAQSKRAPTAHMIRSMAASVSPIPRPSAPRVPPVFTADNDVLTQDWGPTYAECPVIWWSFRS